LVVIVVFPIVAAPGLARGRSLYSRQRDLESASRGAEGT
jgi:hypothetical protein